MRVFISNIDTPLGYNVSRVLSQTLIGSRRPKSEEEDLSESEIDPEDTEALAAAEAHKAALEAARNTPYTILGSLFRNGKLTTDEVIYNPRPGKFVETGDLERDVETKDLIEKFAVRGNKPAWISEVVDTEDKEKFKETILSCDIIVYDLVENPEEAIWIAQLLSDNAQSYKSRKTMVALSSVLTWAKTKLDAEDNDGIISEEEYKRRKSHPNFKDQLNAEKEITKLGKKAQFKSYIITAGLTYHAGESIFHYLFKSAWHNEEELEVYGDGNNFLPMIHLEDLSNIVVEVVEVSPSARYILAIDDSKQTLLDVTTAVSKALSTGKVKKVPKENGLLNKALSQRDYDMLTTDLKLEAMEAKKMNIPWRYDGGIVENMEKFVQEYKATRGLQPLNVLVHGPPASGKTYLAKKLAEHYKIHYVDVDSVMKDALEGLEKRINTPPVVDAETGEAEEVDTTADKALLEELRGYAAKNNGSYPEEQVLQFVKNKLEQKPCQNQGYVLDGFPAVMKDAQALFGAEEGAEESTNGKPAQSSLPEFILSLECSNEFIKKRIMALPEDQLVNTKNSEEVLSSRLDKFRSENTDETTVLNFFDEQEIHPTVLNVETITPGKLVNAAIAKIGEPRNYGPSLEELREKKRIEEDQKAREMIIAEQDRIKREKEEHARHQKEVAEWNAKMDELRQQEKDLLEAQSAPLRNYLMKYVMPTLTSALIDVCKARPEDPIDYIAEHLFKNNPANV